MSNKRKGKRGKEEEGKRKKGGKVTSRNYCHFSRIDLTGNHCTGEMKAMLDTGKTKSECKSTGGLAGTVNGISMIVWHAKVFKTLYIYLSEVLARETPRYIKFIAENFHLNQFQNKHHSNRAHSFSLTKTSKPQTC